MGTSNSKTENGFTFLEIMVAFSIVALVLVAIFQLQAQNIALGVRTRFNVIAPMLAEKKLSEIIFDADEMPMDDNGDFGVDFSGYSWHSEISGVDSDLLAETADRFKRIDIYVGAQDSGSEYHLRTYFLFDREL